MSFLFDQKRILKSDSCLHTTCTPSKSVQLTHEDLMGRKGKGKKYNSCKRKSVISKAYTLF